jgi:hypothetical protein
MIAPPKAIAPDPHTNLLNEYIHIANKMQSVKCKICFEPPFFLQYVYIHSPIC